MGAAGQTVDLARFGLSSGEGASLELPVAAEPLSYGGERYVAADGPAHARVDVARMPGGYSLRLRYEVDLEGACVRCLEDARITVAVDGREVDQPSGGEELNSPYIDGEELDLSAWARDALALALPQRILCRDDCRGLCVECGVNLNEQSDHAHEPAPDPRWAKLSELKLE